MIKHCVWCLEPCSVPSFLVAPSKIARVLDWRKQSGYILSVHVGKSIIDLAATGHPGCFVNPIQPLPSIPIHVEIKENQKVLKTEVVSRIANIAREFKSLGMIVSWPVQRGGWCGASCGKVLHMLDQILQEGPGLGKQPICLWNGNHWTSGEDEWGRAAIYSVPSSKTVHCASTEQYEEEGLVATAIARDFLECHWPSLLNRSHHTNQHQEQHANQRTTELCEPLSSDVGHNIVRLRKSSFGKSLICDRHWSLLAFVFDFKNGMGKRYAWLSEVG